MASYREPSVRSLVYRKPRRQFGNFPSGTPPPRPFRTGGSYDPPHNPALLRSIVLKLAMVALSFIVEERKDVCASGIYVERHDGERALLQPATPYVRGGVVGPDLPTMDWCFAWQEAIRIRFLTVKLLADVSYAPKFRAAPHGDTPAAPPAEGVRRWA